MGPRTETFADLREDKRPIGEMRELDNVLAETRRQLFGGKGILEAKATASVMKGPDLSATLNLSRLGQWQLTGKR